jgi:hypothetical protein
LVQEAKHRHESLVIVISIAVVTGMAIAILLLFLWRDHVSVIAAGAGLNAAIAVCPPYLLVHVARDIDDTALTRVIIGGTVVIGNASLYAGLAMLAMWIFGRVLPRRRT